MIDGARHYLALADIRRMLDGMALAKFNVMHFHASDAESFPLAFDDIPAADLIKGAWADCLFYTMEDLRELEKYAF